MFKNPDLDRAFEFISKSDFDIFCLQEVPEEFLPALKELPCNISIAPEVARIFAGARGMQYLVTLSRYPILAEGRIPLPQRELELPLRGRIFVSIMTTLRLWARGVGNRHSSYADVDTPAGRVRVFNLHLPLATPRWRAEEFEATMLARDPNVPSIVCGDFNILEHLCTTPISWALGGTFGDMIFYKRERINMEKRFLALELTNPLTGAVTHTISRSQLDHILVSRSFEIKDAAVLSDLYGSDHQPICVDVS